MSEAMDPASLDGDALTQWYLRSPEDIEQERQAASDQRYQDFFGGSSDTDPDPDPGFSRGPAAPTQDVDPGFSRGTDAPTEDVDPGFTWVPVGPNHLRSISTSPGDDSAAADSNSAYDGAFLDRGGAGSDDGHQLIDIGNPANRGLRREYEKNVGPWPKTESGRNYDVAHLKAIADGGTNTLDNIVPMHPDAHVAAHQANGDSARWGRRPGIARAFGGTVEPPRGGPTARGFGFIDPSAVTGLLSGRIRTDTFSHFTTDMLGLPSLEFTQPGGMAGWNPAYCPPGRECA
jgi:hypothetical protein